MIKIIEGDFHKGGYLVIQKHKSKIQLNKSAFGFERYDYGQVVEFKELSQDNAKSVLGTLGWGAAGTVALGGLGLLAGVLCGGNKSRVGFVIKFSDGKVAICEGKRKEITELSYALGMV